MIRSGLINMIREFALKNNSAYAIGKKLGISKNTAKKYMQPLEPKKGKPKIPSKLDPFVPQILELMNSGVFNCVVILEILRTAGYDGGKTLVKDFVKPYRPSRSIPAVRRYETMPGNQAQMDWGICQYMDTKGVIHKVPAFALILGNSRAKYVEFTKRCDLASLERCILNAFEYFHGMPDIVLTDNMKTVVTRREAGKTIFNEKFSAFCSDMGFIPKVCRVRRPETKGKVERMVSYVKHNFFPGRKFFNLEDLNKQALEWCKHVDSKPHGTTGLIPIIELTKEPLNPLPAEEIMNRYRWETRHISHDGFVSFDGSSYGVNWRYSGKDASVRLIGNKVQIYVDNLLVAEHPLNNKPSKYVLQKGQYKGLAENHGLAMPSGIAYLEDAPGVTNRPLDIYDKMMEGIANA